MKLTVHILQGCKSWLTDRSLGAVVNRDNEWDLFLEGLSGAKGESEA